MELTQILIFRVCKRWLEFVALAHVVGGILLFLFVPHSIIENYVNLLFLNFNISDNTAVESKTLVLFLVRLFGPTIASWGILMWYLVRRVTEVNDTVAANFLIAATVLWFTFDTSLSLKHGITAHGIINLLTLLSIIVPLLLLKMIDKNRNA